MTQTDDARGPDWEGFCRDLLEEWPVRDVDGSELFDAALRNRLIAEIPGGYDPNQHIDAEGICPEAGDPWYEYAFHPVRADLAPTPPDPRVTARRDALEEAATVATDTIEKMQATTFVEFKRYIAAAIRALIDKDATP